jgi:uncharacterized repeat protein (TIGR01451 family)
MEEMRRSTPCHRSSLRRSVALGLPLALLGTLILVISANAYVSVKTESTLADFDSGTFLYTGLLDIPTDDIHSVQLLPIGLTGNWQTSGQPLPQARANLAAVGNGDYVYVVGGTSSTAQVVKTVYSSTMSVGGELAAWSSGPMLPEARAGAGLAVWPVDASSTMLYVVGGFDSDFVSCNTVFRAVMNNDTGAVGSWTTDDQALPVPLHYASVLAHDGYLYVIGGSAGLVSQDTAYYAEINPDGSLDSFESTASLLQPTADGYGVVYEGLYNDTLYLIGGTLGTTSTYEVYFADFSTGGELTPWTLSAGNLPIHLYGHSGVLVNGGEILLTGGIADSSDPQTGISSTVKAALVDPGNPSFRLYDWCLGVSPPTCTVGAWQTGALLPQVRAAHASVAGHGKVYVLGGQDRYQDPQDTVFYGDVTGAGSLYSPEGTYLSDPISLGNYPASLVRLTWHTTIGHPGEMGLSMEYRTSRDGIDWAPWSDPVASTAGYNEFNPSPRPSGIRFVQYRASFTTAVSVASPLLDEVQIYYDVADPDLEVRKDTGAVISVPWGANLVYTIYYTNTGHYPAPRVVLTETIPEHTTYAGSGWHQLGSSNTYTRAVGEVGPEVSGYVPLAVDVDASPPESVRHITNTVEIDYPPLIDVLGETIVDPVPGDNVYEFSNPLAYFAMAIAKEADPPTTATVQPSSIITYTIYYTNSGMLAASQLVLTDIFDVEGDYTVISAEPPPDRDGHIWDLGILSPRAQGQIEVAVQLAPALPNNWTVTNQAMLHSPEGDAEYTSVLTHVVMNPPGTPLVDLTATDIHLQPANPEAGQPVSIIVDIANIGTQNAGEFLVELYVKPSPSSPPSGPADHEGGFFPIGGGTGRIEYTWNPSGLTSGTSASLTFPRPGYGWSDHPFPQECTQYDIYVQLDVAANVPPDSAYWGHYAEADETNNVVHLTYLTPCDSGIVYLPMVIKH